MDASCCCCCCAVVDGDAAVAAKKRECLFINACVRCDNRGEGGGGQELSHHSAPAVMNRCHRHLS